MGRLTTTTQKFRKLKNVPYKHSFGKIRGTSGLSGPAPAGMLAKTGQIKKGARVTP
jgi:hypothetical protein